MRTFHTACRRVDITQGLPAWKSCSKLESPRQGDHLGDRRGARDHPRGGLSQGARDLQGGVRVSYPVDAKMQVLVRARMT